MQFSNDKTFRGTPEIYKYFTGGGFNVQISKETLLVEYLLTKLLKKPQTRMPQPGGGTFSGQGIKLGAWTLVINNHKFRDALANLG